MEEVPSSAPSHEQAEQGPKKLSNEDEPDPLLKWASDQFNRVINEMRAHLLDTSRPPNPRLANGFADWERFGFNSLAVEGATRRGEVLTLVLSATDPGAGRDGLKKYRRVWGVSLGKWFGAGVEVRSEVTARKK